MSGPSELPNPLDIVTPPSTPPSKEPDPKSREEQLFAVSEKLSASAAIRSQYFAERERSHLKEDCERLTRECRILQERVDRLSPAYAEMQQAYRDTRASNNLSTIMMVVGGSVISIAGLTSLITWKVGFGAFGVAPVAWGAIVSFQANWSGRSDSSIP